MKLSAAVLAVEIHFKKGHKIIKESIISEIEEQEFDCTISVLMIDSKKLYLPKPKFHRAGLELLLFKNVFDTDAKMEIERTFVKMYETTGAKRRKTAVRKNV